MSKISGEKQAPKKVFCPKCGHKFEAKPSHSHAAGHVAGHQASRMAGGGLWGFVAELVVNVTTKMIADAVQTCPACKNTFYP